MVQVLLLVVGDLAGGKERLSRKARNTGERHHPILFYWHL
jgi:hypothetical protein